MENAKPSAKPLTLIALRDTPMLCTSPNERHRQHLSELCPIQVDSLMPLLHTISFCGDIEIRMYRPSFPRWILTGNAVRLLILSFASASWTRGKTWTLIVQVAVWSQNRIQAAGTSKSITASNSERCHYAILSFRCMFSCACQTTESCRTFAIYDSTTQAIGVCPQWGNRRLHCKLRASHSIIWL